MSKNGQKRPKMDIWDFFYGYVSLDLARIGVK